MHPLILNFTNRHIEAHALLVERHCECQKFDISLLGDFFNTSTLPVSQDTKTTTECCTNGIIEAQGEDKVRLIRSPWGHGMASTWIGFILNILMI